MYPFMARTAHAAVDLNGDITVNIIEHNTPVKSHPLPTPEPTPSLDLGTGIHGAFNVITSNCELHHGLRAYAVSKEKGHNSMLQFCREIQRQESGEIGAGLVTLTTGRPLSQSFDTFYDELDRAGAIEGNDMNDRWGFDGTSLPQYKYGFDKARPVSHYTPDDGYSRLPRRERFVRDPRTWELIDTWK